MNIAKRWTSDELLILLNLYHKLNFGQFHARQPTIIALAEKLHRSANSVAMKLCNFASLDPALRIRGIKGLAKVSSLDREMWSEFHKNLNETVPSSEEALRQLFAVEDDEKLEILPQEGVRVERQFSHIGIDVIATVKQRRGQEYFRDAVLNNFGGCCGVTRLSVRELLVASHILPWATHPTERLNVCNGLSLSRLHDAAFDRGYITFDDELRLRLSPKLKKELSQRVITESFGAYEGVALSIPSDAVLPDGAFLAEHRRKVFRKT